jgi:DNA-binding transcriptional MerR regulator
MEENGNEAKSRLTIDELARRTGMTVRNVRAHQSRGLLPPPEIRGRTGYYGPEHAARLEMIKDLQAEGFSLGSIRRLLDNTAAASAPEVLDFARALTEPFSEERPEIMTGDELLEPWGDQLTPDLLRRIMRYGLLRDLGDGRFEVASPRLIRASRELAELGVPLATAIDVTAELQRHSRAVAKAYVELFLNHVWRPFEADPDQASELPQVRDALERLRPLATQSLVAIFQLVMSDVVEQTMEREIERIVKAGGGERQGKRRRRR